jgi:hypothetical protein
LLVKFNRHFRAFDVKCIGGADGRAETAVDAFSVHPPDILGGFLYADALVFQVLDPVFELFPGTGKFHDHQPFFPGENGCVQNIKRQIKLFGKVADNGFLNFRPGKPKNENPGIHGAYGTPFLFMAAV